MHMLSFNQIAQLSNMTEMQECTSEGDVKAQLEFKCILALWAYDENHQHVLYDHAHKIDLC